MSKKVRPIMNVDKIFYGVLQSDSVADKPVYTNFKQLVGAKEFGFVPNFKEGAYYEDGVLSEEINELNFMELTINVTDVLAEDMNKIFGVSLAKTGGYFITNQDISADICVAVRFRLTRGIYRYAIFYKGQMKLSEGQVKNEDDKPSFSTKILIGKFKPLMYNNLVCYWVDSDDAGVPANLDSLFFESPIVAEVKTETPAPEQSK